ncbi:hypothetical protein ACOSQ3_014245 [Xanthoceras sorbifolium]
MFSHFLFFILLCNAQLQLIDFELLCVLLWQIWFRRNKVLWQPPPTGTVKVNIDVAVDVSSLLVGFGMVVRDSSG